MKYTFLIILIFGLSSCKMEKENSKNVIIAPIEDNAELIEIYRNDQADRTGNNIDWSLVSKRDSLREIRIYQLLDSNKVRTSQDYHNAAMIFQHGRDSIAYGMAVKLMRKSIELDSTADKWLLAAAVDRFLLSKDQPQIYGTQYQKGEPIQLAKMDTSKVSDSERIKYGVKTLRQQRKLIKQRNGKPLSELLSQGKSMEEIIDIIKLDDINKIEYNSSEFGITFLAFDLMNQNKYQKALKICKVNTELYPDRFNTWACYGDCLLALGRKEEGINAYQKSLELNPDNKKAQKILDENK